MLLASEARSYICGVDLVVDGGMTRVYGGKNQSGVAMQTDKSEERHIICVVRSQAPHREWVKDLLLELVGPARLEEGCLYYDLYQQLDEPDTFYIVDGWRSEAAVAAHAVHLNVLRVVDQLLPLLVSPLEVTTSTRVSER